MDKEDVMREVDFSLPERIVMADELKKVQKLMAELSEVFESDWDPKKVHHIWQEIGFPMQYMGSVFNHRFHEAVHRLEGQ